MQRLLLLAGLLLGCGNYPIAKSYVPTDASLTPQVPPGVPSGTPNFLISASAAADIPYGSFGITTDGTTWYLEWQTTGIAQRFGGDIFCPQRCVQSSIHYREGTMGSITVLTPYHFKFDAQTQPNTHVHLEFHATKQPVVFSLQVDGAEATNPKTIFASDQKHSSVDVMPFGLVSSNVTADKL